MLSKSEKEKFSILILQEYYNNREKKYGEEWSSVAQRLNIPENLCPELLDYLIDEKNWLEKVPDEGLRVYRISFLGIKEIESKF